MRMQAIRQFQRYYHTVKYLHFRQVNSRLWFWLRRQLYRRLSGFIDRLYDWKHHHAEVNPATLLKKQSVTHLQEDEETIEKRVEEILLGKFRFLNTEIQFGQEIDWCIPEASKLWRYNLHYFDYVRDLGLFYLSKGSNEAYEKFKNLVQDWIERNKIGQSEGWEAYPVSGRIVNWIFAFHLFAEKINTDSEFHKRLLKSLFKHALFLERNIEYHICGNHLIKNSKALIFAGLFFKGKESDRWYKKGISLLSKELHEQILPDGGHFERSPMYHLIVLQDYLEVLLLLWENKLFIPSDLEDRIKLMLDFLSKILQPDGSIPLLNESAFEIATHPKALLEIGTSLFGQISADKKKASFAVDSSGYYVMRDKSGEKYMIVDCGKICPDYLPPHAHADTLSYELSIGNERIIVDSGVYEYATGRWRDFFRSTRAHNTVVVDGLNQSDVWGSFRAGRRAFPTDVKWVVKDDIIFFEGGHDGYLKQVGVLHKRRIIFVDNDFWLILDELDSTGTHIVEEYLHFHPEIEVTCGDAIVAQKSKRHILQIIPFGRPETQILQGELEPIQGWYSPEFGVKEPNPVVLLRYEANLPIRIGYGLFPQPVDNFSIESSFEEGQLKLKLNSISYRIEVADNDIILQKERNT